MQHIVVYKKSIETLLDSSTSLRYAQNDTFRIPNSELSPTP